MCSFANSVFLVASVTVFEAIRAQVTQSCFLHGDLHGGEDHVGEYVSDLPMLEMYYDPKM